MKGVARRSPKPIRILQGPTELKQRSRNNTCTPIAMGVPQSPVDPARGDGVSVEVFVLLDLGSAFLRYVLVIDRPPRSSPESTQQLIAHGQCQRNTENTPIKEDAVQVLSRRAQKIYIKNSTASSLGSSHRFCAAGLRSL